MSKRRHEGPGPVPARWLHCPRKGIQTITDKFIVCKTPLGGAFDDQVDPAFRFPPSMLFDLCKANKIKIGLWIDLTNTKRFYNKREIESRDAQYVKLECRGHGETPSKDQTTTFISLVHKFIANRPLECIAVHCTHGFNRSGFLIVSYLVERMDCSLEIALAMFAKARPPGIYKEDYLQELYRRYDDIDETPPPPELPDWCNEEEDVNDEPGLSGYTNTTPSSSQNDMEQLQEPPKKRFKADTSSKKPVFMEGVPGVTHFTEQPKAYQLQRQVQKMCRWKSKSFPGSQPVSMDENNLQLLSQKPYRVSWKADGTRYMMLIDGENEVYFFDRDHCIFKVQSLYFPHRKQNRHLENTLLDGEMVIDKFNGTSIPRYLAYDIISFESQDVWNTPFYPTRLSCIENEIIRPRNIAIEKGFINKSAEPFSIRKKEFWHITQAANLLGEKFAKTLSHEPDGLIFQPSKESYVAGRCEDVLKWKPPELNSVDFKLKLVTEGGVGKVPKKVGYLYVGKYDLPFATVKYTRDLKEYDNKIIECKYENNEWKFMRIRTDKSFPNAYSTALGVCESIRNPVTKEKLLEHIRDFRYDDDAEIMPPPRSS